MKRPEFEGETAKSPVTGQNFRYFPRKQYVMRQAISGQVVAALIAIVCGVIASIFYLRVVLSHMKSLVFLGVQWGSIIVAIINAVQIQVLNALYTTVAVRLTDYENHRTDTVYEDSLIAKTFVFTFINSFATLFYTAYFKPFVVTFDPCLHQCMSELSSSLVGQFTACLFFITSKCMELFQ